MYKASVHRTILFAALVAWTNATEAVTEDIAAVKKLYVRKCAKCHEFYNPTNYDDKTWNFWMIKMKKKARLKEEQYNMLYKYLDQVRSNQKEIAHAQ